MLFPDASQNGDVRRVHSVESELVGGDALWVHTEASDGVIGESVHTKDTEEEGEEWIDKDGVDVVSDDAVDEIAQSWNNAARKILEKK